MNNEKNFNYEIVPDVSELNEYGILKPYAYQNLFGIIAEKHLNRIKLNVDTTMKYGLAWVLISISLEIIKPVNGCNKLYAQTWHSQRKGPFFRRELLFKDKTGKLLFHGSTFSVLLDLQTRSVFRKKKTPFYIGEPIPEFTIDASPYFKTNFSFTEVDIRKVYNSYIDCLGHVNNSRYGEFAYDALNDKEKKKLHRLKRYDVYFSSELKSNDIFSVQKANINSKVFIRGVNRSNSETSFDALMDFDI
ncbi:MAG: acyl-ACP thioesterase domain-containing protein [Acetivibrionales bacterium]|jgi:medium-chain acyl-[acyl-carrier-protein] hydrolase